MCILIFVSASISSFRSHKKLGVPTGWFWNHLLPAPGGTAWWYWFLGAVNRALASPPALLCRHLPLLQGPQDTLADISQLAASSIASFESRAAVLHRKVPHSKPTHISLTFCCAQRAEEAPQVSRGMPIFRPCPFCTRACLAGRVILSILSGEDILGGEAGLAGCKLSCAERRASR